MRTPMALALCATALILGYARPAVAGLDACNNISVEVDASCKIEVGGGCKTKCKPLNFVTTCTTKRYNACRKECTIEPPTVDCTGSCQADCGASCTADLGKAECQAGCQGRCVTDCKEYCTTSESGPDCAASCDTTCSNECYASCEVVPPSASCEAYCEASCDGSCKITAPYVACQTKCQEREYQDCETELVGGCEAECTKPEGALFCNDQFIDHGGQLEQCVDALNDLLTGRVDVSGSTTVEYECDDVTGRCRLIIGGKVAAGCSAAPGTAPGLSLGLLLVAGLALCRRRRRR